MVATGIFPVCGGGDANHGLYRGSNCDSEGPRPPEKTRTLRAFSLLESRARLAWLFGRRTPCSLNPGCCSLELYGTVPADCPLEMTRHGAGRAAQAMTEWSGISCVKGRSFPHPPVELEWQHLAERGVYPPYTRSGE